MDTHLLSNIQKLFSERIDIFSPVEFNKVRSWGCHHVPEYTQRPQTAHLPTATCSWCQGDDQDKSVPNDSGGRRGICVATRPRVSLCQEFLGNGGQDEGPHLPHAWTPSLCLCAMCPRCPLAQVSVLTGIIKISLKTLLECVRLRTLGRFGLQQVQVDGHYLQLYLWRFASDERVVQGLLDEVAASAAHRCLDPVPMEHSVVELICERG